MTHHEQNDPHGYVHFVTRYRVNGTDALANRLWQTWQKLELFAPERVGEFINYARMIVNTIDLGATSAYSDTVNAEFGTLFAVWGFVRNNIITRRRPDGTPAEVTQDEDLLKALFDRLENDLGTVVSAFWWDAYDKAQATYAPAPARTIVAPDKLTTAELADPNSPPPDDSTGSASGR